MLCVLKNITSFSPYNKSVRQIVSSFVRWENRWKAVKLLKFTPLVSDKKDQTQIYLIPKFMHLNPIQVVFNF